MPALLHALARPRPQTRAAVVAGIAGFAVALSLAAQVALPIPGTPVPLTLQPFIVVLAGLWLGPRAAAASMVLYLMAGAAGLPVFAPLGAPGVARLLGPTGGYLLAYPAAAFVAGWLALRAEGRLARIGAAAAGIVVMYLGGGAQLALLTGSLSTAVTAGVLPFAPLDLLKAAVAALLVAPPSARRTPRARP